MKGSDHVKPAVLRKGPRVLERGLEVVPVLDQLGTERAHRSVLLHAVAMGHDDRRADSVLAGAESDGLPVVASRCRHDALVYFQLRKIHEAAAQLESADRRVVLVLQPHLGPDMLRIAAASGTEA